MRVMFVNEYDRSREFHKKNKYPLHFICLIIDQSNTCTYKQHLSSRFKSRAYVHVIDRIQIKCGQDIDMKS